MENVVLQPTKDIINVCNLLDNFIHRITQAFDTIPNMGEYEAIIEGLNLLVLIIRNVEAVIILARTDLVLYPGAMNLTRSVFEMAMKTLWMLDPKDAFDREVRWLAQLQTEEEFFDRISKRLGNQGLDITDLLRSRDIISGFKNAVTKKLPEPYKPISKIPNLVSMMESINLENKYSSYILLSQFSHGTHIATGTYRKGLGNGKKYGEFITPMNWGGVFSICWFSLANTSEKVIELMGGDVNLFLFNDFIKEIQDVIHRIEITQ